MAVDTIRKRSSCIGMGLPFRICLPVADGTLDYGDRAQAVGLYAAVQVQRRHTCGIATIRPTYSGHALLASPYAGIATVLPSYRGEVEGDQC